MWCKAKLFRNNYNMMILHNKYVLLISSLIKTFHNPCCFKTALQNKNTNKNHAFMVYRNYFLIFICSNNFSLSLSLSLSLFIYIYIYIYLYYGAVECLNLIGWWTFWGVYLFSWKRTANVVPGSSLDRITVTYHFAKWFPFQKSYNRKITKTHNDTGQTNTVNKRIKSTDIVHDFATELLVLCTDST